MVPPSFHIQQNEHGKYVVIKDGAPLDQHYDSRADAQAYIDTWRAAATRLKMETAHDLPADDLTDEERKILFPERRSWFS